MIALWLAYAIAVAGLVGLAAWAVERVLRAWERPTRHVWAVALVGSLVVPVVVAVAGVSSRMAVPPAAAVTSAAAEVATAVSGSEAGALPAAPSSTDVVLTRAVELLGPVAPRLASLDRPLETAWIVASGGVLLLLLLGLRAMARRRSGWRRQTVEGRPVLVAPDFGPAVVGVRRPEIVVPEWALRLERRLLQLVLLHEDQHRSAGDTVLLTVGALAVAAAPWNPLLWWQLRRLRLAVEMDCDRRVLGRGVSRVAYGRLLLEVGRRQPRSGLAVAALAEPKSSLERRIHMITTRGSNRSVLRAAMALTFAALLVVVACETPIPTELEGAFGEAGMTVEDVATVSPRGSLSLRSDVLWIMDGVIVSDRATVAALDPGQIESIEVVKGEMAVEIGGERARGGLIRITTHKAIALDRPLERLEATGDGSTQAVIRRGIGDNVSGILRAREITARAELDSDAPPLIMVDGVVTDLTPEQARGLDVGQIEILTGEAALDAAGERGVSGVIRIMTREAIREASGGA